MRILIAAFLCFCLHLQRTAQAAEPPHPSTILFVTSTADPQTDHALLDAFLSRWRERESFASILHCPLAPNAYTMSAEAARLTVGAIAARLGGTAPTLIVAQGDPAFFLSLALRRASFPGVPMLAFDVVGNEARRKQFEDDETLYIIENSGIGERNVEFGARVFPKRKRAVVLIFVGSEMAQVETLRKNFAEAGPGLEIEFVLNPTAQAIADPYLRKDPEKTFVIGLNPGWVDNAGLYLSGKTYARAISETYGVPVFEYLMASMDGGTVGGVGFSSEPWGLRAAELAMGLVFDGKEPDHWMPGSRFVTPFADYVALRRFGSSPNLLPPGTELINRPPSAWVRYQAFLQVLLWALAAALAYLAFRAIARRRESRLLVEANARLEREVAERTRDLRASNEELSAANASLSEAMLRTEQMQEALLRSTREITLGRLSASMANGLNSPLGAVRSSNAAMRSIAIEGEGGGFPGRMLSLDAGQRELFLRYAPRILSREDYLSGILAPKPSPAGSEAGAAPREDLREIADELAESGLQNLPEEELELFAGLGGREVAQVLYRLSVLDRSTWIIDEAVERAVQTIRALGDYASEGGPGEAFSEVDLHASVERALLYFRGRIPWAVTLATDLEVVPPVRGGEAVLARVWISLVQNALQAMPEGGRLDVSLRADGRFAVVTVDDEGAGIDPSIADRIFEPFVTTRPVAEGMGLSLAFCKRSIEAAGGDIGFKRREKGTSFFVRLPFSADG